MGEVTFGLTLVGVGVTADPAAATDMAGLAEDLGFSALWVPEHVVVPARYHSRYPYSDTGRMPERGEAADDTSPDPLVWLTYVAAATSRIKLGTGVFVLPQRNPLVVAKQTATVDYLSGGRLKLGIGVGWLREEFLALGETFENRGRRTDEYITVIRRLWGSRTVDFDGDYVRFAASSLGISPVQPGGIPILVGGDGAAAARRAGRLGDGWFPGNVRLEEIGPLVELMGQCAAEAGRDPEALELLTGFPRDTATFERLRELNFSHFTVGVAGPSLQGPRDVETRLKRLAQRVGLR